MAQALTPTVHWHYCSSVIFFFWATFPNNGLQILVFLWPMLIFREQSGRSQILMRISCCFMGCFFCTQTHAHTHATNLRVSVLKQAVKVGDLKKAMAGVSKCEWTEKQAYYGCLITCFDSLPRAPIHTSKDLCFQVNKVTKHLLKTTPIISHTSGTFEHGYPGTKHLWLLPNAQTV